jgi:hypothetical protein
MRSNIFTSRGLTLVIMLTLTVSLISIATPTGIVRAGQNHII